MYGFMISDKSIKTYRMPVEDNSFHDITLINERHCHRTLGGFQFTKFSHAQAAFLAGGQLQNFTLKLRHPERMLCDLSNLDIPFAFWSKEKIEQVFLTLDAALSSTSLPSGIRRITGDDLRPELVVSGPSLAQLDTWRDEFLTNILQGFSSHEISSVEIPRGITRTRALIDVNEHTQQMVRAFTFFYSQFVHPAYWNTHPALNLRKLYSDHPVWHQIAALPGRKLFILSAGLSLGASYMSSTGDVDIYFTEQHRQNDSNQLSRIQDFNGIYPEPPDEENWVVIDKSYSGGTIDAASSMLENYLRRSLKIIKVALFPKSLQAIKSADYIVYAGRLFRSVEVFPQLSPSNWHLELLRASQ
jgi:hypothetical protein